MQKTRKNKLSDAPTLTTPAGEKYRITAGRKLQEARSYCRDPEITDAQFRALFVVIDRLNDGRIDKESRWGSAYPSYDTLAMDIGKDERAAKRIIKELATGQRETRSKGKKTTLKPCKAVLNVKSTKIGKTDKVNEYRLKTLGAFAVADESKGAVTEQDSGGGAVTSKQGCGDQSEGVRSPGDRGEVTALDSSHLSPSETPLIDPPSVAPASGERGTAGDSGDDGPQTKPGANDNQSADLPTGWSDQFWNASPGDRRNVKATEKALIAIVKTGVKFEDILTAAKRRHQTEKNYSCYRDPLKWLADEPWRDNHKPAQKRPESVKRMAI